MPPALKEGLASLGRKIVAALLERNKWPAHSNQGDS
jgi:hypothetical protein